MIAFDHDIQVFDGNEHATGCFDFGGDGIRGFCYGREMSIASVSRS